jgi:hypothetical protein
VAGTLDLQALNDRAARVRARVPISSIIGVDVTLVKAGREMTGLCPFHADRKVGSFMVNDGMGIFKCFSCGAKGDVIEYLQRRKDMRFIDVLKLLEADAGIDFTDAKAKAAFDRERERRERANEADAERRRRNAKNLWLTSAPGLGTPAQQYLEGRGIDFAKLGRFPGAIRYRHDLKNGETSKELPAMLTAIHGPDGFMAVHRTWLEHDGRGWKKARLDRPKMVLGDFYGGSMPLWKGATRKTLAEAPAGSPIALSEGIEDALSVACADPDLRVHAAVSIDNIGNVVLPPQVGDLIVLCQRDQDVRDMAALAARRRGDEKDAAHHERAAEQIAAALLRAITKQRKAAPDRAVRCAWPAQAFKDFNDELRGVRMEGR